MKLHQIEVKWPYILGSSPLISSFAFSHTYNASQMNVFLVDSNLCYHVGSSTFPSNIDWLNFLSGYSLQEYTTAFHLENFEFITYEASRSST